MFFFGIIQPGIQLKVDQYVSFRNKTKDSPRFASRIRFDKIRSTLGDVMSTWHDVDATSPTKHNYFDFLTTTTNRNLVVSCLAAQIMLQRRQKAVRRAKLPRSMTKVSKRADKYAPGLLARFRDPPWKRQVSEIILIAPVFGLTNRCYIVYILQPPN